MSPGDREALNALQRRLSHAECIAKLLAEHDDTPRGEALRGISLMISDCGDQLEAILEAKTP